MWVEQLVVYASVILKTWTRAVYMRGKCLKTPGNRTNIQILHTRSYVYKARFAQKK